MLLVDCNKPIWIQLVNKDGAGTRKAEVEKVVEAGKELPRKYLRLAESFKENDTNCGY